MTDITQQLRESGVNIPDSVVRILQGETTIGFSPEADVPREGSGVSFHEILYGEPNVIRKITREEFLQPMSEKTFSCLGGRRSFCSIEEISMLDVPPASDHRDLDNLCDEVVD